MPAPSFLRILIAASDPQLRSSLRDQLIDLGYDEIAEACDGQQAAALSQQFHPDLIVIDIEIPDVDGPEASLQIAQSCSCPIIILTSCSVPELLRQASTPPVYVCLVKPVRQADLGLTIEQVLARSREAQPSHPYDDHVAEILDIRTALRDATSYLITRKSCSPQQAWDWIQQEARAKRAKLYQVAQAIVHGQPIEYQYDVPI
jgi:AmiR/NasT family two-component response regulator